MSNFIGFHITNEYIADSTGKIVTEPPYLGWLLDSYPNSTKVFYDMDASVASLCRLLNFTEEEARKLLSGKIHLETGYTLTYFPKTWFSIDYSRYTVNFANMNQVGYLDSVSYSENETIEDSINKAKQARDCAIEVAKCFQSLGLSTDKLASPIATFLGERKLDFIPTMDDCPDEVNQLARDAIKGQWFENYNIGYWDMAYDLDVNGSYCFELSKLPSVSPKQGIWQKSVVVPDLATLGIAKGYLYTQAPFHPFIIKLGGDNNFTPTGKDIPTILTLQEIQFLKRWNLGTFTINEGHWFIPNPRNVPPYAGVMNWLWGKKANAQGRLRQIVTRLYSGLWGRSLMTLSDGSFGDMYNPIIGVTTETNSRLHVAEACLQNNLIPLAIMADGFVTDKEDVNLPISNKLGEWKLSAKGKCIIAGSGMVCFEGDNPPEGLALRYDDLVNQIKESPDASEYTRSKYSPVTLALALQQGFDKLGTIQKVDRTLKIGEEDKRIYYDRPKTGQDLISGKIYNSTSWDYKTLKSLLNNNQDMNSQPVS